jgi:hypothetical protein
VIVSVATPDEFSVPVPSVVTPFWKDTVSPAVVRLPAADGLSVAVSNTDCPKLLAVGTAVRAMAVVTGVEAREVVPDRLEA